MNYCVIIRTLDGKSDAYMELLDSIKHQTIPPKYVYVVQPYGYQPPSGQIGIETFVQTRKGMWSQRIFGLEYADRQMNATDLHLVCDDDISFELDFMEQVMSTITDTGADMLIPRVVEKGQDPKKIHDAHIASKIKAFCLGSRKYSKRYPFRFTIGNTAGNIANISLPDVAYTQSGNFACFIERHNSIIDLNLWEESWIEQTRYALPDDQVFFYKAFIKGKKIIHCNHIYIVHNGISKLNPERQFDGSFASGRNFLIFWHRFLYSRANTSTQRLSYVVGIVYRIVMGLIYYFIKGCVLMDFRSFKGYKKGIIAGYKYIRSDEYHRIPKVC